jgi:hypothetical protein
VCLKLSNGKSQISEGRTRLMFGGETGLARLGSGLHSLAANRSARLIAPPTAAKTGTRSTAKAIVLCNRNRSIRSDIQSSVRRSCPLLPHRARPAFRPVLPPQRRNARAGFFLKVGVKLATRSVKPGFWLEPRFAQTNPESLSHLGSPRALRRSRSIFFLRSRSKVGGRFPISWSCETLQNIGFHENALGGK